METDATVRRGPENSSRPPEKLTARRNASPEAVAAHQRARLHSAMIEACARHGYSTTTTQELVALAGVSKKALYQRFAGKEDCFLATYDLVVTDAVERISAAYRGPSDGERDWSAGLCRAFDAFIAEIIERPKPTRLALLEVLAAGPAASGRIERAEAIFAQMIARSLAQAPEEVAMPESLLRSLVGGIWFVTRSRLLRGRPNAIRDSGGELLTWMLAYRQPAVEALPHRASVPAPARRDRPCREEDERTRLLRAVAKLAAGDALPSLTPLQIALQAGVDEGCLRAALLDRE